jgi:phosphatidylglycerophosphate synthase
MLDAPVRRLLDPLLERLAGWLHGRGLRADVLTIGGFIVGCAGCAAIAFRQYHLALGLILLNRLADGLDGAVARKSGSTDVGGFLDATLDTLFYSGVPFAFALSDRELALPAAFLIYSFVGTGGSFLAYAIIAGKRGPKAGQTAKKSFYYSAGLMEGTETVGFFVLFCLLPERFAELAWVFGALCWATTVVRIGRGVAVFRNGAPQDRRSTERE